MKISQVGENIMDSGAKGLAGKRKTAYRQFR
jgi:hypothetical protein